MCSGMWLYMFMCSSLVFDCLHVGSKTGAQDHISLRSLQCFHLSFSAGMMRDSATGSELGPQPLMTGVLG